MSLSVPQEVLSNFRAQSMQEGVSYFRVFGLIVPHFKDKEERSVTYIFPTKIYKYSIGDVMLDTKNIYASLLEEADKIHSALRLVGIV